jgi:hypothetical protein
MTEQPALLEREDRRGRRVRVLDQQLRGLAGDVAALVGMISSVRPRVGTALRAPPLPHAHSDATPPGLPSISVMTS